MSNKKRIGAAIKLLVRQSFALEGRVVPSDFVRSDAIKKFLEERHALPKAETEEDGEA